jgi:2-oxo-4-hydroxy-4-carboxy-5-ureidoimidazoline decarboxylase
VATGKSASMMIEDLLKRLDNDPRDELMIAADEQNKITQLRLQKLFS